jgi:hypothetical protein
MISDVCHLLKKIPNENNRLNLCLFFRHTVEGAMKQGETIGLAKLSAELSPESVDMFALARPCYVIAAPPKESYL